VPQDGLRGGPTLRWLVLGHTRIARFCDAARPQDLPRAGRRARDSRRDRSEGPHHRGRRAPRGRVRGTVTDGLRGGPALRPVVRDCDTRSVDELGEEVERLADAARAGTLTAHELRGSTFTVTSAGKLAGLVQTPIVNYPEVAILGVGRIGPRPVVRDGEVVV